ncbi:hypothetical protein MAPG_04883 [Magnaporthiopsis poae ATCC 64411]|uniref:Uncharacterized protein n=1 Tax=Magnaporthiopsis poae (strain ATCC 64411 / 73-15) TaxID=644358 RepID=A0A0C4DXX6_MAGP6|nr:hypothetical protein MAPG_04883 [Magnaporthiopsis poae ATCC 64411]
MHPPLGRKLFPDPRGPIRLEETGAAALSAAQPVKGRTANGRHTALIPSTSSVLCGSLFGDRKSQWPPRDPPAGARLRLDSVLVGGVPSPLPSAELANGSPPQDTAG